MRNTILVAFTVLASSSTALALNQSRHYQVTYDACRRAGMPQTFCQEVGARAYNVDHYEFNDMAAHGQMANGQTACDGAQAGMRRLAGIGVAIRKSIKGAAWSPSATNSSTLAMWLGRALHTIQDNCAHSGMPNPQHAWWSLSDTCHSTSKSPDIVPAAASCAQTETEAVMAAVVDVLHDVGGVTSSLVAPPRSGKWFPSYVDVCDYLGSADAWNGEDRRWDNTVVRPAFRKQLLEAIQNDVAYTRNVCALAKDGLLLPGAHDVGVFQGTPSCAAINAFCLGKADTIEHEGEEEEPPYDSLEPVVQTANESEFPTADDARGCSVTPGSHSSGRAEIAIGFGFFILAFVLRRRARLG